MILLTEARLTELDSLCSRSLTEGLLLLGYWIGNDTVVYFGDIYISIKIRLDPYCNDEEGFRGDED